MHTNRLINETSPYLLQHAHNPVEWYPWGKEALEKAKKEDKPILVSIGYAACHWCHVMEKESFEDEETAAIMNRFFVNIKIDREERPDLDHIYMDAVQAITGSGGWPLNVFLTPEAKPFYGGTYFPPVAAYNRMSWKDVLNGIHKAYSERKSEILSQAENLTEHIHAANFFGLEKNDASKSSFFTEENVAQIAGNILQQADAAWGGFGKAPKFPQTFSIQFLLRHYHQTKNEVALQQALLSLDKMIEGGIYDQLGGGFARYSTDAQWLAPHFEKMLYDNALLIGVLSEAYQLTQKELYAKAIRETAAFVQRELMNDEFGFYSALDADSEGVEGKFYTWSKSEIVEILGADAEIFCSFYDVSDEGNWEHTNILRVLRPLPSFATDRDLDAIQLQEKIDKSRHLLFNVRNKRVRPQLDDKILLGWNALMNTAFSKAYAALGEASLKELALKNMRFLEMKFSQGNGHWKHTYKNGEARIPAFLDDYAYLIQAYLHLQEITGDLQYLLKAKTITEWVIESFGEEESGFFYFTHNSQQDVIVRKKEVYDGATPSGNATMAVNLLYLSILFNKKDWYLRFEKMLQSIGGAAVKYPTSFGVWASAMQIVTAGINEIVFVGPEAESFIKPFLKLYLPNKVFQVSNEANETFPLLKGRGKAAETQFFLCKNYSCHRPLTNFQEFCDYVTGNYLL